MNRRPALVLAFVSCLLAAPASGHPFHGAGDLAAGLAHPFLGIDHLLAMLAIGLWASRAGARAAWAVPGAFVLAMLGGFGLGLAGVAAPGIEPMIAVSVLVLGLLVASRAMPSAPACLALAGGFAVFHGLAHAIELPAGGSAAGYAAGFVLATAALHAAGLVLGRRLNPRIGGLPIALVGAWMLMA